MQRRDVANAAVSLSLDHDLEGWLGLQRPRSSWPAERPPRRNKPLDRSGAHCALQGLVRHWAQMPPKTGQLAPNRFGKSLRDQSSEQLQLGSIYRFQASEWSKLNSSWRGAELKPEGGTQSLRLNTQGPASRQQSGSSPNFTGTKGPRLLGWCSAAVILLLDAETVSVHPALSARCQPGTAEILPEVDLFPAFLPFFAVLVSIFFISFFFLLFLDCMFLF